MADNQKWIDRIKKLLERAEHPRTPQDEAESCYAKAQELMTKWAIEESMLHATQRKSTDQIIKKEVKLSRSGLFDAMVQMYAAVAAPNDVKVLVRSKQWKDLAGVVLIGYESDIAKVEMLYASIWIQCAREQNREIPDILTGGARGRWRRSFRISYAYRIGDRLMEARRSTVEEEESSTPGTALVLRSRTEEVEEFFASIPKGQARASRRSIDWDGASKGRSAADRADIGQPRVGGSRRSIEG
jgi:hypothetical protein